MLPHHDRLRSQQLYLRARTPVANTVSDVVSPLSRPDRSLLAALACFALAGLADAPLSATPQAALALSATVVGVYATARYARSVERLRLVRTAIVLWIAVVMSAAVAAAGGAVLPDVALQTAAWTGLLAAGASSAFLGFQEYAGPTGGAATVEGELEFTNN